MLMFWRHIVSGDEFQGFHMPLPVRLLGFFLWSHHS
jgi:hypothetical protein